MAENGNVEKEFLDVVMEAQHHITDYVKEKVLALVKSADPNVKSLFFPDEPDLGLLKDRASVCRELSVRYVSFILAVYKGNPQMAAKINDASYNGIRTWFDLTGHQLGEDIYGAYLKERLSIPESFMERNEYFSEIIDRLTTTAFTEVTKAISATKSPVFAQLIICGLKVLDCKSYNSLIISWGKTEFFQKKFAGSDLFKLLCNYPWLEEYNVDVLSSRLSDDVYKQASEHPDDVWKWIESPEGPRAYGLYVV